MATATARRQFTRVRSSGQPHINAVEEIMRERRGPRRDVDLDIEREPRMPDKWKKDGAPSLNDVRAEWESIFCPECGKEHPDTSNVRIRRTGQDYEARCLKCGAVIAHYDDGLWSA
jgi:predicted RNA-binding Zn-ribbon protein involved in translation (DUF1610 family)